MAAKAQRIFRHADRAAEVKHGQVALRGIGGR